MRLISELRSIAFSLPVSELRESKSFCKSTDLRIYYKWRARSRLTVSLIFGFYSAFHKTFLKKGFRSSFKIPEVSYELGNFIT